MTKGVTSNDYPDMIADEDMSILVAITANLVLEHGNFRLNLPNGAWLTNIEPAEGQFGFAGIDSINGMLQKVKRTPGMEGPYEIIMPSEKAPMQLEIGSLFGAKVLIDPSCPRDRFIIRPIEKEIQDESNN